MKKIYLPLVVLALSLILTGCEARDVFKYVHEAFREDYLMDPDLESATWKNSAEPGAITGGRALDATRDKFASTFTKKRYFDEIGETEDKGYVYFNKQNGMYLAVSGLVTLEGEDYYEIIMFSYEKPDDIYDNSKIIAETYYVNIKTLEIFASSTRPIETFNLKDDKYGFELNLPKEYEENYITLYGDEYEIELKGKETKVRTISVSYREGNVSNDLFDIVIFEGTFEAKDFNTEGDAYFLGANNKYSICLVARQIEDNYLQNPRKILTEDLEMIANTSKIFKLEEKVNVSKEEGINKAKEDKTKK